MLALVNRGTFDSATGGTFQSDTGGTFHSDIPGTFESDMDGTFKVLQSTYSSIASLMQSTMYLTSSSVTYGPAGRHMPTLKMASLTPLT